MSKVGLFDIKTALVYLATFVLSAMYWGCHNTLGAGSKDNSATKMDRTSRTGYGSVNSISFDDDDEDRFS